MKRKLLAGFMAVCLILTLLPATALAAETLPAARDGVITLTEDVTLSSVYNVTSDTVIDLAGHKLAYNGPDEVFLDVQDGSLTIRDSVGGGQVKVDEPYNGITGNQIKCVKVSAGATFTLEGGTLTNTNTAFEATQVISNYGTTNIKGGVVKGVTGIFIFNPARGSASWTDSSSICNVSGGSIVGVAPTTYRGNAQYGGERVETFNWSYGIAIYGPGVDSTGAVDNTKSVLNISAGAITAGQAIGTNASNGRYAGYTINMSGGTVDGGSGTGMYLPAIGVTNISGGTVSAAQAIRICAGTLNVTGGTITCTAVSDGNDLIAGGSGGTLGAIVVGKASPGYVGDIDVNVSGSAVVKNTADGNDDDVYPTIVVSDKNMAETSEQTIKNPDGTPSGNTFKYSETSTSVSVNAMIDGDIVKISNVSNTPTLDGGSTSLEITGGSVTGNVINQTSEGDLNVAGATIGGDVKNGSMGSVTISQATVSGGVSNTSTGDVLINEHSQVGGNVENTSGSVGIVNSIVTGTATGAGTTIVNSTVNGNSSTTAPGTNVALVGGKTYTNLQTAINAAKTGDTVILLQDVTLNGTDKVNNNGILLISGKNIILDGNGKTIKAENVTVVEGTTNGPSMINIQGGANVTVKNLTIDGEGSDPAVSTDNTKHGLNVYQSTVTVENVTIKNGNGYGVVANGSTATINGLSTSNNGWGGINVDSKSADAKLTINNANISEANSVKIENSFNNDSPSGNEDPVTEIKGGTFQYVAVGESITNKDDLKLTISGGKFATGTGPAGAIIVGDYLAPGLVVDGNGNVSRPYYGGGSSSSSGDYIVSVDSGKNGSVSVSPSRADKGDTVTITVKPNTGYQLDELTVTDKDGDAVSVKYIGANKYTFTMPAGKVTVKASFVEQREALPFVDVAANAYYYDAVAWAVENGVTSGITDTTFAPGNPCTRAQTVTFLWRAAGCPTPVTTVNPFTDVKATDYYYNAVLWAVENGITSGTTATTFGPAATCTRAQVVTFLYRYSKDAASTLPMFADVAENDYYYGAVAWAVENGVTTGVTETAFQPGNPCTRGQIVTFLYRYMGE